MDGKLFYPVAGEVSPLTSVLRFNGSVIRRQFHHLFERHYLNGSLVFMDDLGRDREADASTSSTLGGSEEFKEMILEITWDSSSIIFDLHATGSDRIRPGSDARLLCRTL